MLPACHAGACGLVPALVFRFQRNLKKNVSYMFTPKDTVLWKASVINSKHARHSVCYFIDLFDGNLLIRFSRYKFRLNSTYTFPQATCTIWLSYSTSFCMCCLCVCLSACPTVCKCHTRRHSGPAFI